MLERKKHEKITFSTKRWLEKEDSIQYSQLPVYHCLCEYISYVVWCRKQYCGSYLYDFDVGFYGKRSYRHHIAPFLYSDVCAHLDEYRCLSCKHITTDNILTHQSHHAIYYPIRIYLWICQSTIFPLYFILFIFNFYIAGSSNIITTQNLSHGRRRVFHHRLSMDHGKEKNKKQCARYSLRYDPSYQGTNTAHFIRWYAQWQLESYAS